ncbi:S-formylglutathione hydrolase [Spizellomyces punctatus DAOM BR117]|uniref:S-formylglutathione hydrolase n=1 Tax=Spizellomyces punctatus (strain DAOM BR117) TaxID=645134 RepID=A0A0L0H7C2_SPIPD|nr:S-formylglutathione hydrolase [Spizellomyces punctatus DAOM BR117]KNC97112.1 S-formylglutathione hydrolase [Spizellomyces punctatus DAOM BR117]|eukprot:XP_016605152.1 S-formylglutathione hydrolase [Spizellomyces punctatus DAOM BR117]
MSTVALKELSRSKCFAGHVIKYSHPSRLLGCDMKFSMFLPESKPLEKREQKLPVLYFLSGLTCTEDNFMQKAGAQRKAAQEGIILVAPDTSPRGLGIEGEDDSWDLGTGAGFYVDATTEKWKQYKMYSYITEELPGIINQSFPVDTTRVSIAGHSMGGHGALVIGLKNPDKYRSISAFSPIANPTDCPWGVKAFSAYLGPDKDAWKAYDASELIANYSGPSKKILVDQGKADQFLEEQLKVERLTKAKNDSGKNVLDLSLRLHDGYDHSYYFISTFIEEHLEFHAKQLKA